LDTRASTDGRVDDRVDEDAGDADEEGEMVVGDLEPDIAAEPLPFKKPSLELGIIRNDVDEIVHGQYTSTIRSDLHLTIP
jgi:hypothetical protein